MKGVGGRGGGGVFRVDGSLRVLGLRVYGVLLRTVRLDGEDLGLGYMTLGDQKGSWWCSWFHGLKE